MDSENQLIGPNGNITFTQVGAYLMQLLNKFMFPQKPDEKKEGQKQNVTTENPHSQQH
ncbi:MAG: hypothetical protein Q8S31_03430 [Alphaproteobacteria bacterium]|nr:hypothetical protein [Alphaproteobacteria bacterium]